MGTYSSEKSIQIIISLLKQHGIKNIIVSPGATNVSFVGSIMYDPWFNIFSAVDERSAAYIACGMAEETGEPVVLSCTGATASRNYMPGLTEAYYRKLPVLAVTSCQPLEKNGHLSPQFVDRTNIPNDIARFSVSVRPVNDYADEWAATIDINKAILELNRHGGGPAHINLVTTFSPDYSVKELPQARKISRVFPWDKHWPEIPKGKIAIIIGSHSLFTPEQTQAIDAFCQAHNAVVFCDHTSNYYGSYRVNFTLVATQEAYHSENLDVNLMIHIGEITGEYSFLKFSAKDVWRVSPDGEIRDTYRKLSVVFEMPESIFFNHYNNDTPIDNSYLQSCIDELNEFRQNIPDIPFSNTWIASQTIPQIPSESIVHLGILNTLRNWNFFEFSEGVRSYCNVGGFGIDGNISSMTGASFLYPDKIFYGVVGDLSFFYDLNAIGNRHILPNVRIMMINNGRGTEFRNYFHGAARFGEDTDKFIAAAGHFGCKSPALVRHLAEDLGFKYISANNKSEFIQNLSEFISPEIGSKPIIFEVFTDSSDESAALKSINSIKKDISYQTKNKLKSTITEAIGPSGISLIKKIIKK